MLGKLSLCENDLTSSADAPATAYGIEVNPELACGVQQGGSRRDMPALAGRRKDDIGIVFVF